MWQHWCDHRMTWITGRPRRLAVFISEITTASWSVSSANLLDDYHGGAWVLCCHEHVKSRITTVFSILHWSERFFLQVIKGFEDDGQWGYDSKWLAKKVKMNFTHGKFSGFGEPVIGKWDFFPRISCCFWLWIMRRYHPMLPPCVTTETSLNRGEWRRLCGETLDRPVVRGVIKCHPYWRDETWCKRIWVVSNILSFLHYLGKCSNLTGIIQMGGS